MTKQADRERKEAKKWKKVNKVMLSTKGLVFKEKPARKLVDQYISLYIIDKIVSDMIKLQLPTLIRIHSVVNFSWVV